MKQNFLSMAFAAALFIAGNCDAVRADTGNSAIVPYMNRQSYAVVRMDATSIDLHAIRAWLETGAKSAGRPLGFIADFLDTEEMRWVKQSLTSYRAAGGKTIYAVMYFGLASQPGCFFVAPVEPGCDAAAIQKAFAWTPPNAFERPRYPIGSPTIVIGQSVILADSDTLELLQHFKSAPRPDIIEALDNAGNAPITVAIAVSDPMRRIFRSLCPTLPDAMGAIPTSVLAEGIRMGSLSIEMPSQVGIHLEFQSNNADAANRLGSAIQQMLAAMLIHVNENDRPAVSALMNEIHPKIVGDRLMADIGSDDSARLASLSAEAMFRAMVHANLDRDMTNIRALGQILWIYENKHHYELPDTLEQAAAEINEPEVVLNTRNPSNPSRFPAYIYHKSDIPFDQIKDPGTYVVIYDVYDQWPTNYGVASGICVGFADGHVEFISDEAEFKKLLENSTTRQVTK